MPTGARPVRGATPYGARAYGESSRVGQRQAPAPQPQPRGDDRPQDLAAAGRALMAARPAGPGVETEVSIRMFADGGSISVVRHLRAGETVGIEAMIR
ncbi:MAG: hypothetical protein ACXWZS_00065 [Gemmatirosa sp.]